MSNVPLVQLNDGNHMPGLGLGTCAVSDLLHSFLYLYLCKNYEILLNMCNFYYFK